MKFNLPTRERCQEIVNSSEAFYCTKKIVQGYEVELYDYRLASFSDFVLNDAFELRGLCFVKDEKGNWNRHILMNKFFNLGESKLDGTEYSWMYDDIKDKKVTRVQDKLDGSVISPIILPNGMIVMKSKMSFDSDQAKMAQSIVDSSDDYIGFIRYCESQNIMPVFELISPHNQIVLSYPNTELRLLQIRDNETGEYKDRDFMKEVSSLYNISIAQDFHIVTGEGSKPVLDDLIERAKTEEGIEGWILTLEDGQMIKLKTQWYFQLHGLTTEGTRENLLIETILDDRIDDVIAQLPEGEKKEFMIEVQEKVQHKFNNLVVEYKYLRGQYFNKFQEDRKEFALKYKEHELFGYVMKKLNTNFRDIEQVAEEQVKQHILNKTKSLGDAKEFLSKI